MAHVEPVVSSHRLHPTLAPPPIHQQPMPQTTHLQTVNSSINGLLQTQLRQRLPTMNFHIEEGGGKKMQDLKMFKQNMSFHPMRPRNCQRSRLLSQLRLSVASWPRSSPLQNPVYRS